MTFVAHDPSSAQLRFDEAIKLVKILAANEGPGLPRDGEKSNEGPSQTSKERTEAATARIDPSDLADAIGVQASESDLQYILNAFDFNIEERELSERICSDKTDTVGAEREPELAVRRGPFNAERTSPANEGCSPDQKNPALKIIAGLITLEEVATAVVLGITLASWLSVHPVDPTTEAPMKAAFEQSSFGELAMSQTADAAPVAAADITGNSAGQRSNPQTATQPAIVEPPLPLTTRPDTLHPSPERAGADESRSVRQDVAPVTDAFPTSDTEQNTLTMSGVAALADHAVGQEKTFHGRSGRTEKPDDMSVRASNFQSIDFSQHPSPGDSLPPTVRPSEAGETQAVEVDITSSTVALSRQQDPSTSLHATVSAPVDVPSTSAAKAEETLRPERDAASPERSAILRDQTQVLRLRAEREMREVRAKLILSQEVLPQPNPQTTEPHIQSATQNRLPPESKPVLTSNSSREQRLILRAESSLKNGDISGARLILKRAVADGSTRATYLLAQTYDPSILQNKWNVRGIHGDPIEAQSLYSRAQAGSMRIGADPASSSEDYDRDLGVRPPVRRGPDQD